jgi:hypothetical protein
MRRTQDIPAEPPARLELVAERQELEAVQRAADARQRQRPVERLWPGERESPGRHNPEPRRDEGDRRLFSLIEAWADSNQKLGRDCGDRVRSGRHAAGDGHVRGRQEQLAGAFPPVHACLDALDEGRTAPEGDLVASFLGMPDGTAPGLRVQRERSPRGLSAILQPVAVKQLELGQGWIRREETKAGNELQ